MKIKRNSDNWFDVVFGTLASFLFLIPIFIFPLVVFEIQIQTLYFLFPLIYTIYEQWKSNHFSEFTTNFTEKENLEILEIVFSKLQWNHYISYGEIKIEKNKFFLLPLDVTFQLRSKIIYYNFGYENLIRGGRLTFLLGLATIKKYIFLYQLKKVITEQRMRK
jgi:hypothetical protein